MTSTTTYDPTNKGALAFASDLLAYGRNASFDIHGVGDGDLLEMLGRGELDSLVKTSNAQEEGWYLVGKATIGDVDFTLFGDKHDPVTLVDTPDGF